MRFNAILSIFLFLLILVVFYLVFSKQGLVKGAIFEPNIEPEKNIALAKKELSQKFKLIKRSNLIKTSPIGFSDQDDFLNGAFKLQTNLSIEKLNLELKKIESKLGRIRTENKNGPRTIDLDIAVYNNEIIDEDYYMRDFLKTSVDEIWK